MCERLGAGHALMVAGAVTLVATAVAILAVQRARRHAVEPVLVASAA